MNTSISIPSFKGRYSFLSNFYSAEICVDSITYSSVEHAYQAMKTEDKGVRRRVSLMTAKEAKKFGKTVKLRDNWDNIKISIMRDLLKLKFSNPKLKNLLLETGTELIEEGNYWHDTFWGIYNNKGENHLGLLLMEIRKELRG